MPPLDLLVPKVLDGLIARGRIQIWLEAPAGLDRVESCPYLEEDFFDDVLRGFPRLDIAVHETTEVGKVRLIDARERDRIAGRDRLGNVGVSDVVGHRVLQLKGREEMNRRIYGTAGDHVSV